MKKLNKFLLLLVCMMMCISFSSVFAGYQRMESIDYQAYIKEDGNVDVVETWNIYVEDTNTLFKTFDIDSSKYTKITNVKVKEILDNGRAKDFRNVGEWQYTDRVLSISAEKSTCPGVSKRVIIVSLSPIIACFEKIVIPLFRSISFISKKESLESTRPSFRISPAENNIPSDNVVFPAST